ncbi:MAG TPA: DHA2 family efflux MFS transporter permease subunit [Actinopolymorphaceae bacterium]
MTATDQESATRSVRPWPALFSLCLGFFMILLDTTIVNIAIPSMIEALRTGLEDIIWVNSIYLLTFAVPLLLTGRLGDRFGPKRIFLVGLVLFTGSSLACGIATSVEPLIVARAVQGLGAAAMTPQSMAFIYHLFPPGRRGSAMGVWGAVAGLATVSGPLLGGVLVEGLGWEWIFFVNVPIGLLALVMVVRLVPDWRPRHSHRFDPLGITLFCVGLGAAVFGLQEGERFDWGVVAGPVTIVGLLVGGLVLLVAFVVWQRFNRVEPLLPLELYGHRNYALSTVATAALGFALIGTVLPLMLYLQTVRGYTALQAGLISASMAFASGATSATVGRIAERVDGRRLAASGLLGYSAGLALLAWAMIPDAPLWKLVAPLVIGGVGMGAVFAPLATLGTLGLPPPLVGAGSGLFNTFRQVGSVIGSAAVGVFLQWRIAVELPAGGAPGQPGFASGFTAATRLSLVLPAAVLLIGVAACLSMRRPPRHLPPNT